MDRCLNVEANYPAKGLIQVNTLNMITGKEGGLGVKYSTKSSDRGLMLNYCPWCKEPILNKKHFKKEGAE